MAKKPTKPFPDDENDDTDLPPAEPADVFDLSASPLSSDTVAQVISDDDLFDLPESVTEPIESIRAAAKQLPAEESEDILDWDVLPADAGGSLTSKRGDSGSSILSDIRPASVGSGWLDSQFDAILPVEGGGSTSGVNLHDPEALAEAGSASSIFGREATDESSRIVISVPERTEDATEAIDPVGPASIWDEALPADAQRLSALRGEADEAVNWDALKGLGAQFRGLRQDESADPSATGEALDDPRELPQPSEAVDWDAMKGLGAQIRGLRQEETEEQATSRMSQPGEHEDDFQSWLASETDDVATAKSANPLSGVPGTAVGMPLAAPTGPSVAPRKIAGSAKKKDDLDDLDLDEDEDEKPAPKKAITPKPPAEKKKKSGAMGWIGGGVLGLLVGAGGMYGLNEAGVLGNSDSKPIVSNNPGTGGGPNAVQLQQALAKAENDLKEAQNKVTDAEAKAKAGEEAVAKLTAAETAANEAKDQLAIAKKAADKADNDRLEVIKKQVETETKLVAAIKEGDKATLELNATKEDLKAAARDLTTAKATLTEAQKKAKTSEDTLLGIVQEFKAAKLIPANAEDAAAIAALPEATKKAAASASGDTKKLAEALASAMKDLTAAKEARKSAEDDLAKATKTAEDRTKELAEAQKKAKASEDAVSSAIKELKAAKLIDADADAATALAKLPDAVKKASAAAMSSDGGKAAEALLAAKKDLETAQAKLKQTETDLDAAKKTAQEATKAVDLVKVDAQRMLDAAKAEAIKEMKALQDNAAKAVADAKKETDDKIKVAVEKATSDSTAKIKQAEAVAKTAEEKLTAEAQARATALAQAKAATEALATKEADFAKQLAAARASAATNIGGPPLAVDKLAQETASSAYSSGVSNYFAGRYAEAEKTLRSSVAAVPDARANYFLGLTLFAQGKADEAGTYFTAGAALERRSKPNARDVGEALERIQGPARRELAKYRPM